jgi:lysophospholipase L1-like esterase
MLSTLSSKGTKVIVVMSPALAPFGMEPSYQAVEDVCAKYHVPFKDYSQDLSYNKLDYFFDNHMNKDGANLFSSKLGSDIKNQFFPGTFMK